VKKIRHWLKRTRYRLFGRWCKPLDVSEYVEPLGNNPGLWRPLRDISPILAMLKDGWHLAHLDGKTWIFPPKNENWRKS